MKSKRIKSGGVQPSTQTPGRWEVVIPSLNGKLHDAHVELTSGNPVWIPLGDEEWEPARVEYDGAASAYVLVTKTHVLRLRPGMWLGVPS